MLTCRTEPLKGDRETDIDRCLCRTCNVFNSLHETMFYMVSNIYFDIEKLLEGKILRIVCDTLSTVKNYNMILFAFQKLYFEAVAGFFTYVYLILFPISFFVFTVH